VDTVSAFNKSNILNCIKSSKKMNKDSSCDMEAKKRLQRVEPMPALWLSEVGGTGHVLRRNAINVNFKFFDMKLSRS
jgi:hypothetical protein